MSCAKTNFLEGALFLLHKGADRLLQNKRGWTALMLAAKQGHADMCVALLTSAIPVETTNDRAETLRQRMLDQTATTGQTALEVALASDTGGCADILAAYGAVVPRAVKDLAAKQAGSGGWLHLAAAAAAPGTVSEEAMGDARELEKVVQRSSLTALKGGRATQLAKQQELGRELYGTKQPSGRVLPRVTEQGWGPSMAEQVQFEDFKKQFQRDAEWVEMSRAAAPRAMHRKIALDQSAGMGSAKEPSKAATPAAEAPVAEVQGGTPRQMPGVPKNGAYPDVAATMAAKKHGEPAGIVADVGQPRCREGQATANVRVPSLREQIGSQHHSRMAHGARPRTVSPLRSTRQVVTMRDQMMASLPRPAVAVAGGAKVRVPSMREQMAALVAGS